MLDTYDFRHLAPPPKPTQDTPSSELPQNPALRAEWTAQPFIARPPLVCPSSEAELGAISLFLDRSCFLTEISFSFTHRWKRGWEVQGRLPRRRCENSGEPGPGDHSHVHARPGGHRYAPALPAHHNVVDLGRVLMRPPPRGQPSLTPRARLVSQRFHPDASGEWATGVPASGERGTVHPTYY